MPYCLNFPILLIPVETTYADGQYRDQFELDLPKGCEKVVVRLMYEVE
jgi:hypothetical protein